MKTWILIICCVVCVLRKVDSRDIKMSLLSGKILSRIPEFLGQTSTTSAPETTVPEFPTIESLERDQILSASLENVETRSDTFPTFDPSDLDHRYPVLHAGLPRGLAVTPLPLANSDHELVLNVSWLPSLGQPARDYSLEVSSETNTKDCRSPICYEYDIHGDSLWQLIPKLSSPVAETCAIRPGCAYRVRLIAHPWDGHSHANLHVQLDECVAGVCSCAHAPRLPVPAVQAHTLSLQGEVVVNVTWKLPAPSYPLRLPRLLSKQYYFVSIGKQMVSDAHPSPWFAHTTSRQIPVDGPVADGDDVRWTLLPIAERSGERGKQRIDKRRIMLDVKLLARVSLVDERSCIGPAGNATAYDPVEERKVQIGTYALWAAFGGACVLTMVAILALSARVVKRVLNAFRPAAVSAPLDPLCRRAAWFPLQRTYVIV